MGLSNVIFVGKRAVTAKQIITAETGKTNGNSRISNIPGIGEIIWDYRTQYPGGYYDRYNNPICNPVDADYISIYNAGAYESEKYGDFGIVCGKIRIAKGD